MIRIAGLTLALVGALLAGCANEDDGHTDGDRHDMHSEGGMNEGAGHDAMGHGDMDHDSETGMLPAGANRRCPVMDDDVAPDIFTEYKGRKVYFCCDDCVKKFKDDPEKYFAKAYPDAGK